MIQPSSRAYTRREVLHSGLTLASASLAVPAFVQASALALPRPGPRLTSLPGVPQDRILVVVQLSGGNDGLNTVVPFGFDAYYRARPGIAVPASQVLKLSDAMGVGLHPALSGLKALYDDGLCAIVQGVGYPNPNRSHFASMDIWHTADTSGTGVGWLGRYFDAECCGTAPAPGRADTPAARAAAALPGVAIGPTAPLAMEGRHVRPVAFESERLFRWAGLDLHDSLAEPYEQLTRRATDDTVDSNAAFLVRTALNARVASDTIREAVRHEPLVPYPPGGLSRQLAMVSLMIRAGLPTRVYYVALGGFDTHAGQGGAQGRHAQLLEQLGAALRAFYADLAAQGNDRRVLTLTFSEFGRRVAQNASGGTDHGTAAPMMLFGPMVRPGLFGDHPSLTQLDEGDLQFQIDFRSVYADVLEHWLRADARSILGATFRPTVLVRG